MKNTEFIRLFEIALAAQNISKAEPKKAWQKFARSPSGLFDARLVWQKSQNAIF